jgi:hypothetical protein
MTTPSDPNQPGDGSYGGYQSGGLPGYPENAAANEAASVNQTLTPPQQLVGAFWAYVAAALVGVVGGLLVLGQKQQIIDALRTSNAQQNSQLSDSQLQTLASASITVALVIALVIAALYVFFAFKLKAGRNWARIVLTIIAVLALLSLLLGRGGSILSFVGEVAAVIGAVLSYMPQSSAYISAVKNSGR